MEKRSRDFKGVWISNAVLRSSELSLMQKVLLIEIHSLAADHGCFASNRYFSEFLEIHPRTVSAHLSSLKSKGFISMTIHNHNRRVISIQRKAGLSPSSRRKINRK